MSTRKISISQLRKGMFIHELDISWMKSPFLRHRRKIGSNNDIALLKKAGVKQLTIDLSRGDDLQTSTPESIEAPVIEENRVSEHEQQPEKEIPAPKATETKSKLTEELKIAKVLQSKIGKLVNQLASLVKDGQPISAQSITPVINEALESITRNDQALLTMLHLQRQDLKLSDHGFGVFAVTLPLALKLECSEEEINELGMAALLHDTGWARLPMHLFGKKKAYTTSEMTLIQQHPAIVENVLNKSADFPERVKLIVKQHHELGDGSGYPGKLKGDAVHKLTEILQVADAYDELMHGLMDKPGMLPSNALKKIYQAARSGQYSEVVVSAMIHVMGIFPLTSAIELSNGEKALVIEIDKQKPLLPRIQIVYQANGEASKEEKIIDLANQAEGEDIKIIKVIDPINDKDDPLNLLRVESV
ncbi:HD-GYP domain-containing protein [sulfur-oxidizing endosymbiont of Gigantopelta aegis]|uniref:HD-GYP domain-containing protein n=1 Tax=sulfur-oxidizing endosymbiont of Gigantopelta aegis TaxID=2794934 RepID=UPI0018DE1B50|nr:DUF3391 domain-containing protein [sulfur-oxidizing endosymbiont of Gigantopelta aegis]